MMPTGDGLNTINAQKIEVIFYYVWLRGTGHLLPSSISHQSFGSVHVTQSTFLNCDLFFLMEIIFARMLLYKKLLELFGRSMQKRCEAVKCIPDIRLVQIG